MSYLINETELKPVSDQFHLFSLNTSLQLAGVDAHIITLDDKSTE